VDTAYYEVAGNTRAEWRRQLPRAAQAAGIPGGALAYTIASMRLGTGGTRTTSIGCQIEDSQVLLRMGHVMPKLSASAAPPASDREAWDAFVAGLWERAHLREEVGQRLADSLRREVKRERASDCAPLIVMTRQKLDGFRARFSAAVREEEQARGEEFYLRLP
jgi:predicted secreted Zn-dependent protease